MRIPPGRTLPTQVPHRLWRPTPGTYQGNLHWRGSAFIHSLILVSIEKEVVEYLLSGGHTAQCWGHNSDQGRDWPCQWGFWFGNYSDRGWALGKGGGMMAKGGGARAGGVIQPGASVEAPKEGMQHVSEEACFQLKERGQ